MNTATTVGEVLANPAFKDFGRLLFPVDRTVTEDMTLSEISSSRVYTWYNNIQPDKTVKIINYLIKSAESGQQIFYPIYSETEMEEDPSKRDTGYSNTSPYDAPTYACVGTSDGIANYQTMQNRLNILNSYGIPTEFHKYENLPHGFGIGTGTAAEGWIYDAVRFWENQMPDENIPEHRKLANLQDYLLTRTTNAHGNDYDLNSDGVWNVFDLCLMRRRYLTQF
ncbi:MAG: hypothetical protein ACI4JN_11365 [Ruminococcus sp.]